MKKIALPLFACLLMLTSALAVAQTPQRIRGTVSAFDGDVVSVKTREGEHVRLNLTDKTTIVYPMPIRLSDIKPGDFVGSAAVPDKDGKLVAREILLFPESGRGTGEGHYAWDLEPGATMTNANVAKMVQANNGQELTLEYKGGSRQILVPEGIPIITPVPGDRSLFKRGAYIFAIAQPAPDGTLTAVRIYGEKDGVKPPM
ncbi:MAG: hypothetical protein ACM3SV_13445 [Betaproteobacteria bacterium]